MLTDAAAIGLSLVAIRLAARPAQGVMTYGLKRVEILSAQANGVDAARARSADPVRGRPAPDRSARRRGRHRARRRARGRRREPRRHLGAGERQPPEPQRRGLLPAHPDRPLRVHRDRDRGRGRALDGLAARRRVASLLVAALMLRAAYGLLRDSGRIFLEASPSGLDPDESAARWSRSPAWPRCTTCTSGRSRRASPR